MYISAHGECDLFFPRNLFSFSFSRAPSFRTQRECFWVKHYAGKVKYTVEGWVERNMDRIPQSFNDTLQSSTHKVSGSTANSKCCIDGTTDSDCYSNFIKSLTKIGMLVNTRPVAGSCECQVMNNVKFGLFYHT